VIAYFGIPEKNGVTLPAATPKRARRRKPGNKPGGPEAIRLQCSGGQGVCRETESEGHAENYRPAARCGVLYVLTSQGLRP
jgi:hypothetical protein